MMSQMKLNAVSGMLTLKSLQKSIYYTCIYMYMWKIMKMQNTLIYKSELPACVWCTKKVS